MKSVLLKVSSLVLCLVFLAVSISACGTKQPQKQPAATASEQNTAGQGTAEPVKFVKELDIHGFNYWGGGGEPVEGKDVVGTEVEKRLGYKVKFVNQVVASLDEQDKKLQLWTASGMDEWPNIMWLTITPTANQICNSLGKQEKLMEVYSIQNKKFSEEIQKRIKVALSFLAVEKGKSYMFPYCWTDLKASVVYPGEWIRKDWLQKVNLPLPRTIDDLENVLRAFKANIKDKDGKGIIPYECFGESFIWDGASFYNADDKLGSDVEINMMNFLAAGDAWVYKDGKAFNVSIEYPQYLVNALKRYNKWYNEGLIDSEAFVIKAGRVDEKSNSGRVGVIENWLYSSVVSYNDNLMKTDPNAKFVGLSVLTDTKEPKYVPKRWPFSNWAYYVVRADTPKDELDTFCDYINHAVDEDFMLMAYNGVKGYHWDFDADGKVANTPDYTARLSKDASISPVEGLGWYYPLQLSDVNVKYKPISDMEKRPDMVESFENQGGKYLDSYYTSPIFYIQPGPVETKNSVGNADRFKSMVAKAVMAKNPADIEGLVMAWVKAQKDLGYEEIKAEKTKLCSEMQIDPEAFK